MKDIVLALIVKDIVLALITVAVVLGLVALLGHALWLAAASVLKPFYDVGPPGAPSPDVSRFPGRCAGCGTLLPAHEEDCPRCGLAPDSPAASELRELEVTARRLQALRESEALDAATCERVYQCIEARQRELIGSVGEVLPRPEDWPAVTTVDVTEVGRWR